MKHGIFMAAAMSIMAAAPMLASVNRPADEQKRIENFADILASRGNCSLEGTLSVSMPQLAEDVVYEISLHQISPASPDTLAPANYIIDWCRENSERASRGFSAYFNGNHYRLQGDRLLEYHYKSNSLPFGKEKGKGGVQNSAQFTNMLPSFLAEEFRKMASDERYYIHLATDTLVNGKKSSVVRTIMTVNGETANEGEYVFDKKTGLPTRITLENNPGSISEQTVIASFRNDPGAGTPVPAAPLTEEQLIARYPDDFASKRLSSYRLDNLPSRRMVAFEAPTLEGERFTFGHETKLSQPMLIVVAEPAAVFTKEMIMAIRQGVAQLTFPVTVVWAFTDRNQQTIEDALGKKGLDEVSLLGAKGLMRDCGITELPSLIAIDRKGIVIKVASGFNNHLDSDVINMLTNR